MSAAILLPTLSWTACQSSPPPAAKPMQWPKYRAPTQSETPSPQPSPPEPSQKEQWTLDDVLKIAEAVNPDLAVEQKNVDLAAASIWEARLYPNPALLLGIEDYRTKDGLTLGRSKRTMGVGIPLVIGGRIGAATSAAEAQRDAAALHFVWRRREILSDVRRAFVDVLAARKSLELTKETRDIARAFRDATDERFKAQAIPEMEVLKASVNLSKAETEVSLSEKRFAVAQKSLHAAIGSSDLRVAPIVGDLPARFTLPDFDALREQVTARHPLVEEAMRTRDAASREIDVARAERIPDLGFQLEAGKDPEDDNIVQAGLTIPIGLFNRNQAKIESASIRLDQSQRRIASTLIELSLTLEEVSQSLLTAQERVTAYEQVILPTAQRALDQTDEGHRLGKFAFLDVLDAQRTLAEAKSAYAESVAELNLAVVDLEKLTGTNLEPVH